MDADKIIVELTGNQRDVCEGLDAFRESINWSYNQLSNKTGISVANIKKVLTGETDVSMLFFTRVIAAMWEKGIANKFFKTGMRRCIAQEVTGKKDICSITDYAALVIMLWDHFQHRNDHGSTDDLCTIFRALEFEVFLVMEGYKLTPPVHFVANSQHLAQYLDHDRDIRYVTSAKFVIDQCLSTARLTSFFDHSFWMPSMLPDINPDYTLSANDYKPLMQRGETMVWGDIPNILLSYRKENNLTIKKMPRASVILRMENLKNHAYKYDDVLFIDNELQMGGSFFSVCYNATRNSVLLGKIMELMDSSGKSYSKKTDQAEFEQGIHSFFTMLRYLERNHNQTVCTEKVLNVLRNVFFSRGKEWRWDYLKKAIDLFPEYFPENPLKNYG